MSAWLALELGAKCEVKEYIVPSMKFLSLRMVLV